MSQRKKLTFSLFKVGYTCVGSNWHAQHVFQLQSVVHSGIFIHGQPLGINDEFMMCEVFQNAFIWVSFMCGALSQCFAS